MLIRAKMVPDRKGADTRVAACDALTIPGVTGQVDMTVVDQMIELALPAGEQPARSKSLSPEAWRGLRHAMARLAVDLVSGPAGLAAFLRTQLLQAPWNTPSLRAFVCPAPRRHHLRPRPRRPDPAQPLPANPARRLTASSVSQPDRCGPHGSARLIT